MGRPPGRTHEIQVTVRLAEELLRRLRKAAKEEDRPLANMIRRLIEEGLDRREPRRSRLGGSSRKK